MVKKKKVSFKLPKLRKRRKTKIKKVAVKARSRFKPIGQVLVERKKRTQERIAGRNL